MIIVKLLFILLLIQPIILAFGIILNFLKEYPIKLPILVTFFCLVDYFTLTILQLPFYMVIRQIIFDYFKGLLILMAVYTNLYTFRLVYLLLPWKQSHQLDYLIVLGAGLKGTKVQSLLAQRIEKAIQIFNNNPDLIIIMSGGQGPDEDIAEGIAMVEYASQNGVPIHSMRMEVMSTNTHENIRNSLQLMEIPSAKIGIVTSYYHSLRAYFIARELGIDATVFGSQSSKSLLFVLLAYSRELIAYLFRKINWVLIIVTNYTIFKFYMYGPLLLKLLFQ